MSPSTQRTNKDTYIPAQHKLEKEPLAKHACTAGPVLTRRAALKALLGVSALTAGLLSDPLRALATPSASQETLDALSDAEAAYAEAEAKLETITDEYVELSQQLNETVTKIEEVQKQIDAKQAEIDAKQKEIDAKQAELEKKQDQLSARISQDYKTGNTDFLSVLLNSASFEELTNNIYYMGKINASDQELITEVKAAKEALNKQKAELEQDKAELEQDKAELETLQAQQQEQLSAVEDKQQEASDLVANLSDEVKALVEKRDAEILAAAEEEKRQAEAEAAARAAGGTGVTGTITYDNMTDKGAAIVNASYSVGSPGSGLCAMWVSMVYRAAGLGYPGGNANNMYWNFCTSSDKGDIMPGMIIAVSTHSGSSAGRTYGHVGIYVGNNTVRHNIGYIATDTLDDWITTYGTLVTPRWGWAA